MKEVYKNVSPLLQVIDNDLKSNEIGETEKQVLKEIAEVIIKYLPAEKVQRIIYGSWKRSEQTGLRYCSNCNAVGNPKWHYCCNCGAKMR